VDPRTIWGTGANAQPISFDVANSRLGTSGTPPNAGVLSIAQPAAMARPHTFPYLVDNFFYTGAPEVVYPNNGTTGAVSPSPPYIGGPSGAGWYKMFEFLEVPSPVIGATGMVAQGNNFDWFRQDVRPGMLNLNLIIDEEVFLGLMGMDSSDSYQQAVLGSFDFSGNWSPGQTDMQLNMTPLAAAAVPQIVTALDVNGNPLTHYFMPSNGAFVTQVPRNGAVPGAGTAAMKASFADFLRLRNGGIVPATQGPSNFLYGLSAGLPTDRPFRSLSYPDINYTAMRPAFPPPPPVGGVTTPVPAGGAWPSNGVSVTLNGGGTITSTWPMPTYTQDPGMKNPYLAAASLPVGSIYPIQAPPIMPPPIPPRRLFQLPDAFGSPVPGLVETPGSGATAPTSILQIISNGTTGTPNGAAAGITTSIVPTSAGASIAPSNASVPGDPAVNSLVPDPNFFTAPYNGVMSYPAGTYYDLTAWSITGTDTNFGVGPFWLGNHFGQNFAIANGPSAPTGVNIPPGVNFPHYSGIYDGNNTVNGRVLPAAPFQQADMRQHPYYRSEWMQRVMNLSTVRTHQYAVWITIGFFEVVHPGNPQLAYSNPAQAYDQLGMEIGALEGKNTRYRGFFIVDRTRATGFNPTNPGDFRDVIVYRKTIQ
jgi:hypothetical protein